ncbi:hypothetical protein FDP41_007574 [Naegleria fowleri]|uniref:Transmembrane protein n=1 Tax=Naegleria fowleri TaxID=5763 RepID=A0A6A5CEC1_NAEFO|nr:uncharacterized protein FDP41_007574 [Naegleria fowleri]KAF0983659.1 hypothetical protein FDP41_007574 [Naegleria fowleri]
MSQQLDPKTVMLDQQQEQQQPNAYSQPYMQPGQLIFLDTNQQMQGGMYYQPQPQPQYVVKQTNTTTAQPVVVATTTTNVVTSSDGQKAEDAFTIALILSFPLWLFGIGFCFSCFVWIPVLKYRLSCINN